MECSWVTETSIITHVMVCISNCYKGCQMLTEVSVTDRQAFHKFQLSNLQYRRHNLWLRVNENKWAPFNRYHTNSSIARSLHRRPVSRERQSAPWASCQYVIMRLAHAPGILGTLSPTPRASDPDIHHGTCVTHVPWCMSGSLTSGFLWSRWRGNRSRLSRCMRNPQFYVCGKRPMGFLPDTQNCGLCMCRERFPHHRGLAIPTCITARDWRTCRDACRDRQPAVSFEVGGGENVPGIPGAYANRNFAYLIRGP